jgi:hypothetical protein
VGQPELVITWGFPPDPTCIAKIRDLQAAGVDPWWFDGDRDAAFQNFQRRPGHPGTVQDWDRQLQKIEAVWPELVRLYGDRRVEVVRADGSYMDQAEIFSRIFGSTRPPAPLNRPWASILALFRSVTRIGRAR